MRVDETASPRWAARFCGCVLAAVVFTWIVSALLRGSVDRLRRLGESSQCQSNLTYVARGLEMYADDWDDTLPKSADWMGRVLPYVSQERRLHCPAAGRPGDGSAYGYAMSAALSGQPRSKIAAPAVTPMAYDSTDLRRSAADGVTSLPRPGRHLARASGGSALLPADFVAAADGHVTPQIILR